MSMIANKWVRCGVKLAIGVAILILALFAWIEWSVAQVDTKTLPARHGQVDSVLYAHEGGKHPLLVGLGGSEGGNAWASNAWKRQRERFLEQGYAMLALGYFGTPHSPEQLDRISLNGIHDAILAASKDPRVDGRCIAVIGGSRGGELALLLASHYPDIHAVVAIVPGSAVFPALTQAMNTPGFSLHGKPLPFVPVPWSAVPNLLVHNLRGAFDKMVANTAAMDAAAIPVERINGAVYFVSASRDEFWPSRDMSDAMMARLKRHGFAHPAEHLVVAGGHSEPLDEFPKMEAFLQSKFAGACR
ncbi:acyl-CoA thioester hydrolase/BAAT C-terminal domain-containing protein [Thermomonas sp.]|uniref:acyl-CoA thioester hydrolase/BAAT C-terminal domain-containing protein n=1 Tax=Thermomonas sp. TaxID=1971895 RepID=UPI00322063A9